ncbi:MAG: type III pantothenate kinase [Proteobacteria bacterium]|nr:type III pantothenate kinase [Pseudomonadota bacterium]
MFGILDIGNSNFHLAVISEDKVKDYFTVSCDRDKELIEIIGKTGVNKVLISFVSSKCYSKLKKMNWESIVLGDDVKERLNWSYGTMGMDRIANVYYLIKNGISGIIISFGTMFVIDVVKGRNFKGGFIFPGYNSQIECVNLKSDFIDLNPSQIKGEQPGKNTEDAVGSGIFNILKNGIASTVKNLSEQYDIKRIIATGGDSRFLERLNAEYDRYLTVKGIKLLAEDIYGCNWS